MPASAQLHLPLPGPQPGAEGGDSLQDRLCALIVRRGRPLEVGHVASQLLRLRRCPERLQRRLVAEIVEGDARLAWLGRDLVGLAPPDWSEEGLASATFCVVDLETTGGSPGSSKVTEIGAVRVRGLELGERFSTLVNPGRPIPAAVVALTGIDDEMVAASPDIQAGLEDFVAFAGQDVLVAHNAPFDLRFLNYERRRLAGRYFTQAWLDTLLLARRLLNGRVERHDLGTLAAWADTAVRPTHRALPDAEATAELLVVLIGMLAERGVDTMSGAVAFAGIGGARHSYKLALAEDLPPGPGVYVMRDRLGRPLYVGKAANLRRRVRSYFGPGGRHGRMIHRALDQLEAVDHERCGSEFSALLREDVLIKELRPPCNRRGVPSSGRYLRLSDDLLAPRLTLAARTAADGARYHGPVRSERLAREATACLRVLYGLDDEAGSRTADARGLGDLLAGEPAALADLGARLARGMVERPEAVGPDAVRSVMAILAALGRARRASDRTAVVVEPAVEARRAEVFFVAGGVVRHRVEVGSGEAGDACREGVALLRRHARSGPALLAPDLLDAASVVEDRLRRGEASGALVLEPGWRAADVAAHVERVLGRMPAPAPVALHG